AGTTRDLIEIAFDLGGYPASLIDTAGLREAGDAVEAEGIRRARERARAADLRLLVCDAREWPQLPAEIGEANGRGALVVANKVDLAPALGAGALDGDGSAYAVSAKTGAGIAALLQALEAQVVALSELGETPALTRARHRHALEDCCAALDGFIADRRDPVLAAEAVRLAARALGRITGRVDVEDVLDRVFAEFCIGK
ncbi:MAG: tRNA uridine-5-carboxymethylaminomethyl(34) synthesis GTPase MnmE, partial [Alphaproteobacteria bacterium]